MTAIRFDDSANDDGNFDPFHPDNAQDLGRAVEEYTASSNETPIQDA
jgi:hypothetical protein